MTDPERSKGRKKWCTEVRKKGKKVQSDNTANEQEAPDAQICNGCKEIFTHVNPKMICCNRCQKWFCTRCMDITDAFYSFVASKEAEDIVKNWPRKQLLKTDVRNTQKRLMKNWGA